MNFTTKTSEVRVDGRWMLTPLALTMIVIEITDLAFAVDSIPAIFAITQDPFIVYTSNICAILGLRSLYFLLAGLMNRFIYLRTGLALVLGFVGLKMITAEYPAVPPSHLAGNHCSYSGNYHMAFHVEDEKRRCAGTPKIKYCLCCSESFNW